jgi:hypothetical protein
MRFRKLRIAWSAMCGIICLLLIVWWVRSYWWCDSYHNSAGQVYVGGSTLQGTVALHWFDLSKDASFGTGYDVGSASNAFISRDLKEPILWLHFIRLPYGLCVLLPLWLPLLLCVGIGSIPWLRWRFSLRTPFIAATLVAIILGAIAFAAK